MDYTALRTEIEEGPLAEELAPLVTAGRDADVAAALNRRDIAGRRLLFLWELKLHCIRAGLWPKIRGAAASHPTAEIKAVAQTVLDYVDDQRFSTIDIDDAASTAMLGALVAGQVLTEQESADILALAAATVSRAEQAFGAGTVVSHFDVSIAFGRG